MPPYSRFQPFSSTDMPDADWNAAVAQWRAAQGQYDPVSPTPAAVDPDLPSAAGPDVSEALRRADMPHSDWQVMRAQQLAARGGDPGVSFAPRPGEYDDLVVRPSDPPPRFFDGVARTGDPQPQMVPLGAQMRPASSPTSTPSAGSPNPTQVFTKRSAARDFGAGWILDQIPRGEGTDGDAGYGTTFHYGKYDPPGWNKPITAMTLDEVSQFQKGMVARGARSSAVGKYQINQATMNELRQRMGLTGTEIYAPELQDRMARERLMMAGYDKFLAGQISREQLQKNLSGAWTSIVQPNGQARNKRDPIGTDTAAIRAAIDAAKAEADHLRDVGHHPGKPAWR